MRCKAGLDQSSRRGTSFRSLVMALGLASALGACAERPTSELPSSEAASPRTPAAETSALGGNSANERETIRLASFNIWELSAEKLAHVDSDGRGNHPQLLAAAEILQRVRPDVVLINEIDYDSERDLTGLFSERYLAFSQAGRAPLDYPEQVYLPTNTGVPSGFDFDNDGKTDSPEDGWGFGRYPGQYGMALLSRLPIDHGGIRTFQRLLWRDMPGNLMPDGQEGRPAWYSQEEAAAFRLSSKSHWDVPIRVGSGETVHVLASHPTPPVFDGDEDRNGRRNHDEIRFWIDYLDADEDGWMVDDQGRRGGLPANTPFVLMGDLNSDPAKVEPTYAPDPAGATQAPAIVGLLSHARVYDPQPSAADPQPSARGPGGARSASVPGAQGGKTCNFGRIDYALPSRNLETESAGVFQPAEGDPLRHLVEGDTRASDHFLVWVDIVVPANAP